MKCMIPLLGQQGVSDETMEAWGRRAQEVFSGWKNTNEVFPVRSLLIILLVLLLVMIFVWARQWYRNRPPAPTGGALYRKAARQVELGLVDRWFLSRVAHATGLRSPLTLLVSRGTYLHHVHQYLQKSSPWFKPMVLARASRILSRLYGSAQRAEQDVLAALDNAAFLLPADSGAAAAEERDAAHG